jgi:hypothetical protein
MYLGSQTGISTSTLSVYINGSVIRTLGPNPYIRRSLAKQEVFYRERGTRPLQLKARQMNETNDFVKECLGSFERKSPIMGLLRPA